MISSSFPPIAGGVSTHVYYLTSSLASHNKTNKNRVKVCKIDVVTAAREERDIERAPSKPNLLIHKLPKRHKGSFYTNGSVPYETPVKYILDNWSSMQPDVIHAHDYESLLIGMMLKSARQTPLVFTPHRTPKEADETLPQRDPKNCFLQFARKTNLVDIVIAPSTAYETAIVEEGFDQDRVRLIRHGIPFVQYSRRKISDEVSQKFGLNNTDVVVLCPTRLDRHKGVDIFIEAAAFVKREGKAAGVKFLITGIGEEEYYKDITAMIAHREVDDVIQIGNGNGKGFEPEEMPYLYRRAAFCVLPSRREGFGQVILEAAALKRTTIGANTGGIREIITPTCGRLFNRDEPQDLAQHVMYLLNNVESCENLGVMAKKELSMRFDANKMAEEYVRLYKSLRPRRTRH